MNMFDIDPLKNKKNIKIFMDKILCKQRPGDFNQAIMDLGRYICKPQNPICDECPLKSECKGISVFDLNILSIVSLKASSKI